MNKLIAITLATLVLGVGLATAARKNMPLEGAEIVRVKNEDPRLTAQVKARYQVIAQEPLIGMSAPFYVTLTVSPEKDIDLAHEAPEMGGTLQSLEITFPDKDEPLIIDKPLAGKEYVVYINHFKERKLKL